MARLADAENLEIDAAGVGDRVLVTAAELVDAVARDRSVGDVNVLRPDVDMREQILPHEAMVGVDALVRHRVVLVEIERRDVTEAEPLLAMHTNELAIHADRRRSRCESEHGRLARGVLLAYQRRNAIRDEPSDVLVIVDDERPNPLETGRDVGDTRRPASRRAIAGLSFSATASRRTPVTDSAIVPVRRRTSCRSRSRQSR